MKGTDDSNAIESIGVFAALVVFLTPFVDILAYVVKTQIL